jgi:hypothetical protein
VVPGRSGAFDSLRDEPELGRAVITLLPFAAAYQATNAVDVA